MPALRMMGRIDLDRLGPDSLAHFAACLHKHNIQPVGFDRFAAFLAQKESGWQAAVQIAVDM